MNNEKKGLKILYSLLIGIGILMLIVAVPLLINITKFKTNMGKQILENIKSINPIVLQDNGIVPPKEEEESKEDIVTNEEVEQETPIIELPAKKDPGIHKDIDKKLKSLGFKDANKNEKCFKGCTCFYKKPYFIRFNGSVWLDIERDIGSLDKLDMSKDLELIGKMYNNKKVASRAKTLNTIINKSKNDNVSFFLNIDSLHFYIYAGYKTIIYSVGDYYVDDDPKSELDRIDSISVNKSFDKKILLTATFGKDYKKRFPLYTFENNYKNYATTDKYIDITIRHSNFEYKVGFNKSYYSYGYEFKKYNDPSTNIEIYIPGKYFKNNCIKMISADLEYLTTMFDKKFELSKENKESIKSFVSSDEKLLKIVIKDSLYITISNYTNGSSYHLTYRKYSN